MLNHTKILWITRTAILIAVTVSLQALTVQFGNQYITGTIVNMMLIVSVMVCGLPTGLTAGAVTPVIPTIMGFGPVWPIVPFIILGNLALVTAWHFLGNLNIAIVRTSPSVLLRNASYIIALAAGALVKFIVLYTGVVKIAAPLILGLPEGHIITVMFSYPQIITACAGGVCAIILLPALKRALDKTMSLK